MIAAIVLLGASVVFFILLVVVAFAIGRERYNKDEMCGCVLIAILTLAIASFITGIVFIRQDELAQQTTKRN